MDEYRGAGRLDARRRSWVHVTGKPAGLAGAFLGRGWRRLITVTSDAVDWLPRPPPVAHVRRAYGLYVTGESMVPEFEPGDIALVNPHLPVVTDTTCIFYGASKENEVRATIKRLRRKTGDTWYLRQWNPPDGTKADFTLSRKEWPICHRVVGKYSRG